MPDFKYILPRTEILFVRVDEDLKKMIDNDAKIAGISKSKVVEQRLKKSFKDYPYGKAEIK